MLKSLTHHVFANGLPSGKQLDFMSVRSKTQLLLRLTESISTRLDRKRSNVTVFLDNSKAYDFTCIS
jgi:hypothetical protein